MKNFISLFVMVAAVMFSMGCGHIHKIDNDLTSQNPREVHAEFKPGEVAAGDKVGIFQQVCDGIKIRKGLDMPSCREVKLGEATVVEMMANNRAKLMLPENVRASAAIWFESLKK